MNFQELIRARYSVRAYKPDPVEEDKLTRILEAARQAPTAANRQAFRIIVLPTKGREADLRRVYGRDWFTQAPLVLAVCALPAEGWVRKADGWNAAEVDATIAMTHIVLAAAEEGLGTCWIAAFDPAAAREVLGLPVDIVPAAFTPLGYPADSPAPKKRRPLGELVHKERWP
ncbi:MAG: nitroreductase family protein [Candidatus Aminicenantes bacterium]|nr:nitroreductase family protein [Candidatus Aminicenantes bacterium]